jgi:hypothetical protein
MPSTEVTKESNPGLHASLLAMWEREKRPGWVVTSNTTYRVIQRGGDPTDEISFVKINAEEFYESTSLSV